MVVYLIFLFRKPEFYILELTEEERFQRFSSKSKTCDYFITESSKLGLYRKASSPGYSTLKWAVEELVLLLLLLKRQLLHNTESMKHASLRLVDAEFETLQRLRV